MVPLTMAVISLGSSFPMACIKAWHPILWDKAAMAYTCLIFTLQTMLRSIIAKSLNASGLVNRTLSPRLLAEIGNPKTLQHGNKIYCASDGVTNAYGVLQVADLPMACGNGKERVKLAYYRRPINALKATKAIVVFKNR